jgi:cytochrome c553
MDVRKALIAAALSAAAVIAIEGAGAAAVAELGLFDVAASTSHLWFVRALAHHTMIHSVRRQSAVSRVRVSAGALQAGFCSYHAHCAACHGAPATARAAWANGLNPPPPYLLDATTRFTPSQLHWIVANGVKMTAMPAWKASLADRQIWEIVAALEIMPKLDPAQYKARVGSNCVSAGEATREPVAPAPWRAMGPDQVRSGDRRPQD